MWGTQRIIHELGFGYVQDKRITKQFSLRYFVNALNIRSLLRNIVI
jgi:hypothetical protein